MFSRKRLLPTLVAMVALALLLAACGGGNGDDSAAETPSPSTSSEPAPSSGPREIRMVFDDFSFEPQDIVLKSGEQVRFVIVNEGSVPHDWNVDELNLMSPLVNPGQTATFEFTVGAAGSYHAYCAEPGHEALGMVGTLVIED